MNQHILIRRPAWVLTGNVSSGGTVRVLYPNARAASIVSRHISGGAPTTTTIDANPNPSWTVNQHRGRMVRMVEGAANNLQVPCFITSNDADTLTLLAGSPFPTAPTATDDFEILERSDFSRPVVTQFTVSLSASVLVTLQCRSINPADGAALVGVMWTGTGQSIILPNVLLESQFDNSQLEVTVGAATGTYYIQGYWDQPAGGGKVIGPGPLV